MRRSALVGVAVAAAVCLGFVWSTNGQGARLPATAGLETKFMSVYLRSDKDANYSLEKCQLRQLGDQSFLVGIAVETGTKGDWFVGDTVWIAMNDVAVLHEYATLDRMKAVYAKGEKCREEAEKAKAAAGPWGPPQGIPAMPPPLGPGS